MKKYISIILLVLLLVVGFMKTIQAGSYDMVKGKGVAVCDAYYEYLKNIKRPMTCEREFSNEVQKLKRPDWKKLDNDENKLLILRVENYLTIPKDEKATQPFKPVKKEEDIDKFNVNTPGRLLYSTSIDINNDGKEEVLAKYRSFHCHTYDNPKKAPKWKAPIVVLNDEGTDVNINKTYLLMQNNHKVYISNDVEISDRRKKYIFARKKGLTYSQAMKKHPRLKFNMISTSFAAGISMRQGYDVFEFNSINYFDKWNEERLGDDYQSLTIYKNHKTNTTPVCRFQYNQ